MNKKLHKSKGIIVFDLDGTLVDHWQRMYELFKGYMDRKGKNPAVLSQYKAWKISGLNEKSIGSKYLSESDLKKYISWKFRHIEDSKYLIHDQLIPGTISLLNELSKDWIMVLLTSRQHKIRTGKQLDTLSIRKYFNKIIIAPGNDYVEEKYSRVLSYLKKTGWISDSNVIADNVKKQVIFVGDTEREVEVAKRLNATSVAVATGVRGLPYLYKENADLTLQTLKTLPLAIDELKC